MKQGGRVYKSSVDFEDWKAMRIVCVYRTGGGYTRTDVHRLASAVRRNTLDYVPFLCLTDAPHEVSEFADVDEVAILNHDWRGWWSKMELFAITGPLLYFDLDTVITGPIDGLVSAVRDLPADKLLMLRGFYRADQCSGILGWSVGFLRLYQEFVVSGAVSKVNTMKIGDGDQEWIRVKCVQDDIPIRLVQDVFPGVVSYKEDVRKRGHMPQGTAVVCFHGQPKPWEVHPQPAWLREHWGPFDRREGAHGKPIR